MHQLGVFISSISLEESFPRSSSCLLAPSSSSHDIWELARLYKARFTDSKSREYAIQTIGLLGWVSGGWRDWILSMSQRPVNGRTSTSCVSNLGVIATRDCYGPLHLHALRLSQFNPGVGPAILASVATCSNQQTMSLTFTCLAQALPQRDGEEVVAACMREIHRIIDNHT